jgi:hypothetical protein
MEFLFCLVTILFDNVHAILIPKICSFYFCKIMKLVRVQKTILISSAKILLSGTNIGPFFAMPNLLVASSDTNSKGNWKLLSPILPYFSHSLIIHLLY